MPRISVTAKSVAIGAIIGLGSLASANAVHADVPSATAILRNSQNSPQAKQFIASALQAIRNRNLPLATIQLKNALRLEPNNGALLTLVGIVLLQSNETIPAEHQLRQARLYGARDQDAVPPLLQTMIINREWQDVLDQFADPDPNDKSGLAASILSARALAYQSTGDDSDAISSINRSLNIRRDTDGLLTRVRIAMAQSNYLDAMAYVNQALTLSPNDSNVLIMKANVYSVSDKKAALAVVDGVLKADPNSANAFLARIELLIDLGRNDEAQQSVDAVLAKYPDIFFGVFYKALLLGMHHKPLDGWRIAQSLPSAFTQSETRYAMGEAQLAADSGHLDSANSILTTYVGQHPTIIEPRLQLAALHLKMNLPNDALNDMEPLVDSKDPRALEYIANIYAVLKRPTYALTFLHKADVAGAKSGTLKSQLGIADLRQGNISLGVQEMSDSMKMQPGNLDATEAAIGILLTQSKFVEAQALADQADKTNPKSPAPLLFKGEILVAQGKIDDGLAYINQSLRRDPHYLQALNARAGVLMAKEQYSDATRDLELIKAQQPNSPSVYVKLAEIAALSNQPAQSISLLKQAISKDPKQLSTRLILAQYQVGLKQIGDAEATLKATLQVAPNDPQTIALMGQVQEQLGQKAAALATNKMLVEKNQRSGAARFLLANALLQSGDKQGAIAAFKRAIELSPDIVQYPMSLIDLQIQLGDSDEAVMTARGWANSQKGSNATLLLARTLARLKRFSEAASVVAAGQRSQPDYRLTLLESQIAMAAGNRAHAVAILKNWLSGHASDIPVRQAYADALMGSNDNAAALAQYEIILKSRNDIPIVLNNIAWLIRDTDPNRAMSLASKAMQLQPESPDISDTMGLLLVKTGNTKAALPTLEKAHSIAPASSEISYHLALVLNSLGRKADAKQILQAALAQDQTFADAPDAKKLLQKL